VLLSLLFPKAGDCDVAVYDHDKCAADVTASAARLGIDIGKQAVCLMGDNVSGVVTHIGPMLVLLRRREFYVPSSCSHTLELVREVKKKEFIGAEAFELGVNVIAQAEQYVNEMVQLRASDPESQKRISTYSYWMSKKSMWPELVPIAVYWTAFPTSSVSVERAFARLRAMDASTRATMTLPHTERDLKLRVN
jgi:hypothetical protein